MRKNGALVPFISFLLGKNSISNLLVCCFALIFTVDLQTLNEEYSIRHRLFLPQDLFDE